MRKLLFALFAMSMVNFSRFGMQIMQAEVLRNLGKSSK